MAEVGPLYAELPILTPPPVPAADPAADRLAPAGSPVPVPEPVPAAARAPGGDGHDGGRAMPALLRMRFHEASGRWMVVVQDPVTGRVLETMPPEALLDTIGRIRQAIGLMLDERA